MPSVSNRLFGRKSQLTLIDNVIKNDKTWLINYFGPGGIGKTAISNHLKAFYLANDYCFSLVDGIYPNLNSMRVLYLIKEQLKTEKSNFSDFEKDYTEFLILEDILSRGGGFNGLFDSLGQIKDPAGFIQLTTSLGKNLAEGIKRKVSNRYSLEKYMRGIDGLLIESFSKGVSQIINNNGKKPVILIFDTYESMDTLDSWFNQKFIPNLPEGIKIIIFGRNSLLKMNYQWNEYSNSLIIKELPELEKKDAIAFLVNSGLRDSKTQEKVYGVTGGYPLLLVLARQLAIQTGGWHKIGEIDSDANRDFMASELLQRILREEKVFEVRTFLEKGVIAQWFNPEIIGTVLEIPISEARFIYDSLRIHSFVEPHPLGLKFHDKIRETLIHRLKFTNLKEYNRIANLLIEYHSEKSNYQGN